MVIIKNAIHVVSGLLKNKLKQKLLGKSKRRSGSPTKLILENLKLLKEIIKQSLDQERNPC